MNNWINKKISEFKFKAKKIFKRQEKIDPSSSKYLPNVWKRGK